jgi:endonuclease-3
MVILSAQDSDRHINDVAPKLFQEYPSMKELATAKPEDLFPILSSVRSFRKKSYWLTSMAKTIGDDKNIPATMEGLTALPGIGRKSASVIMGEMGMEMEGIQTDLHVLRVAPRLGIAGGTNSAKIEKQLMEAIPQKKYWRDLGMSLSFLGREICRPTNPKCPECVMNKVCEYFQEQQK